MYYYEFDEARKVLKFQKIVMKKLKHTNLRFKQELLKLVELLIMVKGHAWCMDVKQERRKISRLVVDMLVEVMA